MSGNKLLDSITNSILVADDDRTNMMFLKKGVKNLPYNFTFVEDGTAALNAMLESNYDLFLLDVFMPGLSGFEVIEEYQKERPDCDIPFLFLTGNDDKEAILKGFNLGAVDYITKPYSMQEIRKRIKIHHDLFKSRKQLDSYAKEMESLAQARADQLLHADRLATLGTMSAGIMHEINNPATFISGNIQLLQNKFLPLIQEILEESGRTNDMKVKIMMEELPKMCEGVLTGVARIKKITDGLKAFSRSHKTEFKHINLNNCVNNALLFCKSSIPKSIEIEYSNTDNLPEFNGDSQQIEQIIINLLVNASHALEDKQNPSVTISTALVGNELILRIKDNGPGIPDHVLEKMWEPFFTTKPKGKGTGLGLAICREMIEAHNGSMEYTGELGKGAEFTITIPVGEAAA